MDVRALCLGFTGAEETYPFTETATVFKVRGKIFAIALLGADPPSISLKCEPALAEQLRADHPAITPGYHLNKRHWNTVALDGSVPERLLRDMVEADFSSLASVARLGHADRERSVAQAEPEQLTARVVQSPAGGGPSVNGGASA